ncbi:hypothetical protein B0T14DRAFT_536832 [Immersiella caudata]|uniref:feruloyl esterase n=1 Tax=Immersiella caudata TaxID=314043 RepID=A0AA39WZF2_9PEZI|nr:hypothetical protein B0T14DRAFT_536832 [Immersiella caudata]
MSPSVTDLGEPFVGLRAAGARVSVDILRRPPPSAGCGKTPTLKTNNAITSSGKQRCLILKLSDDCDTTPNPTASFSHSTPSATAVPSSPKEGGVGTASWGIPPATNNSAIFISPNGQAADSVDVEFADDILATVSVDLCFNTDQAPSTGLSYGGAISYTLACARPRVFRAVAVMKSNIISSCEGGTEPIVYYHQHGTKNQALPFSGAFAHAGQIYRLGGVRSKVPDDLDCVRWGHTISHRESGAAGSFTTVEVCDFFSQFT